MTVKAFVLIKTEEGSQAAVRAKATEIAGVLRAEAVTGPYEVIVEAQADSRDDLCRMVVGRLQAIDGIARTLTCSVVEQSGRAYASSR